MKLKDFLDVYDDANLVVFDENDEIIYNDDESFDSREYERVPISEHWTVEPTLYPYYSREVDVIYADESGDKRYSAFHVHLK